MWLIHCVIFSRLLMENTSFHCVQKSMAFPLQLFTVQGYPLRYVLSFESVNFWSKPVLRHLKIDIWTFTPISLTIFFFSLSQSWERSWQSHIGFTNPFCSGVKLVSLFLENNSKLSKTTIQYQRVHCKCLQSICRQTSLFFSGFYKKIL